MLQFDSHCLSYLQKIYFQFRNEIGSSVEAPATIVASVLDGSSNLLPDRLRQLAKLIREPDAMNLGLNHSVFGKVKGVQLSSYLQHKISGLSPSPSPAPSPSQSPSPSMPTSLSPYPASSLPGPALAPSWSRHPCFPCFRCNPSPAGSSTVKPPCIVRDPRLPPLMRSPKPPIMPSPPKYLPPAYPPVPSHVIPPRPLPNPNHFPKAVSRPDSQMMPIPSPSRPVSRHWKAPRKKGNSRTSNFSPIAPSPYGKFP